MKFIIIGKNIDVTPGLREAVESKLGKLERYFTPNTEIHVTLSVQKGHQKIEVTIPVKGGLVRSEQESSDMYVSIDLVEEVIERQLRKYKNKLVAREQEGGNFKQEFFEEDDKIEDLVALIWMEYLLANPYRMSLMMQSLSRPVMLMYLPILQLVDLI